MLWVRRLDRGIQPTAMLAQPQELLDSWEAPIRMALGSTKHRAPARSSIPEDKAREIPALVTLTLGKGGVLVSESQAKPAPA